MNVLPSRTERYLARVTAHLPTIPDVPLRQQFISQEIEKWEQRYARFIETQGLSHRRSDATTEPCAFDFVETLAALEILLASNSGEVSA